MAKNGSKRREWTKTYIRELITLARAKTPAGKIARSLKRTEGATRQKAFTLGVSLDSWLERQFENYSINRPATSAGLTFLLHWIYDIAYTLPNVMRSV